MDKNSLFNKIKEFGLNSKEEYMAEAFSRNIGLLTQAEQDKLSNAKVAIPGMESVGYETDKEELYLKGRQKTRWLVPTGYCPDDAPKL